MINRILYIWLWWYDYDDGDDEEEEVYMVVWYIYGIYMVCIYIYMVIWLYIWCIYGIYIWFIYGYLINIIWYVWLWWWWWRWWRWGGRAWRQCCGRWCWGWWCWMMFWMGRCRMMMLRMMRWRMRLRMMMLRRLRMRMILRKMSFSSHPISSHMSSKKVLLNCFHLIRAPINLSLSPRSSSQLISAVLHARKSSYCQREVSCTKKQVGAESFCTQTLETQMHLHRKAFSEILCTTKLAQSTSQYYFVLQSR